MDKVWSKEKQKSIEKIEMGSSPVVAGTAPEVLPLDLNEEKSFPDVVNKAISLFGRVSPCVLR